jgi:hypothetical protein
MQLAYSRISQTRTKYFFQKDGVDIEFYIDHDAQTGMADLWVRPGYSKGIDVLAGEMISAGFQAAVEDAKK